jgi:hypothetical protein
MRNLLLKQRAKNIEFGQNNRLDMIDIGLVTDLQRDHVETDRAIFWEGVSVDSMM